MDVCLVFPAGSTWNVTCTVAVENGDTTPLSSVAVKLARDSAFTAASSPPLSDLCPGQDLALANGITRRCKLSVVLDASDITSTEVVLRAGATSTSGGVSVHASQTALTLKLGAINVTATPTGPRTALNTIPIKITVVNLGPTAVTNVTLQLPDNVTLAANSPCDPHITSLAVDGQQVCEATYTIIPEVAEGLTNSVNLTFTASAALLNAPVVGKLNNLDLGRNLTLQVVPSVIGVIGKAGELASSASCGGLKRTLWQLPFAGRIARLQRFWR